MTDKKHGGKREGAGRPKAPPIAVMRLRIPLDAYEKIKALGGDRWAKRVLFEQLNKGK